MKKIREILFRGKRTDNKEWVEGFYCQFHNRPITNEENSHQIFVAMENAVPFGSMIGGLWYEVIPETVGQFTGLTDKNGKKIFEGDIIRGSLSDLSYKPDRIGFVKFGQYGWIIEFDMPEWKIPRVGLGCFGNMKVIGNIHDNPELLKNG